MLAQKNQYIESAYERLQIISQDKEKRLEYEAREKAIRDYSQSMLESRQEGRQEGIFGAISICRDLGMPDIEISKKLQETYGISEETAKTYLQKLP